MGLKISDNLIEARAAKAAKAETVAKGASAVATEGDSSQPKTNQKRKSGHTRPQAPSISLDQPGRLRVAHVLAVLGISHATLYAGMKVGRYPRPDGYDGAIPYWNTETIRLFLQG